MIIPCAIVFPEGERFVAKAQSNAANTGCLAIVAVLGLLTMVGMCSTPKGDKTARSFASPSLTNQIEAMPTPAPAPISALSAASVRKARQHLTAVVGAEGLSGAMIYSQNCYDALSRAFAWAKLDQCGGFDMLAVEAANAASSEGLEAESAYFEPEAAAGRYLALATKAGEEASEADKRLEALQRQTSAGRAPVSRVQPSEPTEEPSAPDEKVPLDNVSEEADV
jgi:hypothetical protein